MILVSLAVADLFVSLVVMPCCIVQEFIGQSSLHLFLYSVTLSITIIHIHQLEDYIDRKG